MYEVLSHKNWGSSSTLMNEVARDTFDYDKCELAIECTMSTFQWKETNLVLSIESPCDKQAHVECHGEPAAGCVASSFQGAHSS